jgi:hypothetical protein
MIVNSFKQRAQMDVDLTLVTLTRIRGVQRADLW